MEPVNIGCLVAVGILFVVLMLVIFGVIPITPTNDHFYSRAEIHKLIKGAADVATFLVSDPAKPKTYIITKTLDCTTEDGVQYFHWVELSGARHEFRKVEGRNEYGVFEPGKTPKLFATISSGENPIDDVNNWSTWSPHPPNKDGTSYVITSL